MKSENASVLTEMWSRHTCPILTGVMKASGDVVLLDLNRKSPLEGGEVVVEVVDRSVLSRMMKGRENEIAHLGEMCRTHAPALGFEAISGEGSLGSDGFVALTQLPTGALQWVAFFEDSNPFEYVEIDGEFVIALNTLGETFRFPLNEPERVVVVPRRSIV